MPSLLDAIAAKYGSADQEEISEAPIGIYVPRIGARKSIPRLLILNDCDVDSAGEEDNLEKTCSGVLEIDLAHNRLSQWSEISKILQYSPSVTFLNLSFNNLSSQLTSCCVENSFRFPFLPRLSTLILIGTTVSWECVWFLLRRATGLNELHLSLNDFDKVDTTFSGRSGNENGNNARVEPGSSSEINSGEEGNEYGSMSDSGHGSSSDEEDGICYPHLKRLMFDGNPITSWEEVGKLGMCFPFLRHVGLADCPISSITQDACQYFENLQSISLSNTLLSELADVSRLNFLPSLTELRIQGIPLLNEMTAYERRQLLISLLPKITKMNGGAPISVLEREDAERAFIRRYAQHEDPPARYHELTAIHGELAPLIDVQLKPASKVKIRICYETLFIDRVLSVYQTTNELKGMLEPLIGISPPKMRLFYIDPELQGIFGREEMKFPNKQLYSYNIQDGDEIHVEQRTSVTNLLTP